MRVEQLHHVAIHVADLERSVTFYREVLCLQPLERPEFGFEGAWFRLGETQELHLISRPPKEGAYTPPRERHIALLVDDIAGAQVHLDRVDAEYQAPKERPGGAVQIFLRDPDEHVIELFAFKT